MNTIVNLDKNVLIEACTNKGKEVFGNGYSFTRRCDYGCDIVILRSTSAEFHCEICADIRSLGRNSATIINYFNKQIEKIVKEREL